MRPRSPMTSTRPGSADRPAAAVLLRRRARCRRNRALRDAARVAAVARIAAAGAAAVQCAVAWPAPCAARGALAEAVRAALAALGAGNRHSVRSGAGRRRPACSCGWGTKAPRSDGRRARADGGDARRRLRRRRRDGRRGERGRQHVLPSTRRAPCGPGATTGAAASATARARRVVARPEKIGCRHPLAVCRRRRRRGRCRRSRLRRRRTRRRRRRARLHRRMNATGYVGVKRQTSWPLSSAILISSGHLGNRA